MSNYPDKTSGHPVTGKQLARNFWDNIDMSKSLYNRFYHLGKFFTLIILDLSEGSGIQKGLGEKVNRVNWIVENRPNQPGPNVIKDIHEARITLGNFSRLWHTAKENGTKVSEDDMNALGLDERGFAHTLRKLSAFIAWAYDLVIDDRIRAIYETRTAADSQLIPQAELDRVKADDLADNKSYRFPFIIIIDNSLSMGESNRLVKLQQGLANLVHEIERSSELSRKIELYVATCGGKPAEVVDFAMIDRQMLQLDMLILKPFGKCKMAEAMQMALNKLQARLDLLSNPSYDIKYYRPWMLILSDGNFRDDMDVTLRRIRKEFSFMQVYARGVSQEADMEKLRRLDPEAAALDSLDGFFKDVFVSLRRVKDSVPGEDRIPLVNQLGFTKKQ